MTWLWNFGFRIPGQLGLCLQYGVQVIALASLTLCTATTAPLLAHPRPQNGAPTTPRAVLCYSYGVLAAG